MKNNNTNTITDAKLESIKNGNQLKNAVIEWLEEINGDERQGYLEDLLNHGCVSGMVGGMVYYKDTCSFYTTHKEDIFDLAYDQTESFGHKNTFELFANLNGAENVGSIDQMENLLAWYGFEEMARQVADELELEI